MRRIAILIDALNPRARASEHPPQLVDALCRRGLQVELHWVSAGLLARLDRRSSGATDGGALEGAWSQVLGTAPEALLAYDPSSPAAWLASRLARRLQIPLLLIEPAWFSLRPLHERLLDDIGRRAFGRGVRRAACGAVALDPVAVERFRRRFGDALPLELVPTGVDTRVFRPGAASGLLSRSGLEGKLVLHVGPLRPERDLERLIAAYARTVGQRPDWTLVLAGEGPLRGRLETEASRMGVRANVRFLPRPELSELPGLMCASTLLVVPGVGDRVRGRQIARAMASGLPVLAARTPRLEFRVDHERTGLLVDAERPDAWTEALDRAAGSPATRTEWASAALADARTRLDWDGLIERYLELLRA